MTCPYRFWCVITNRWECNITLKECPEVQLEGFDFKQCSTYKQEIKHKLQREVEIQ